MQAKQFAASKPAPDQHCQNRIISKTSERISLGTFQKSSSLFGSKPVPEPDTNAPNALHPSNAGSQFGTEQTRIRRFESDPTNCSEAQVDRSGCVLLLFEEDSVAQNYGPVEREPWL